MIEGFSPERMDWMHDRKAAIKLLIRTKAQFPNAGLNELPKYKLGTILAGEKLRRDGALPAIAARFGEKIMAIEMEGSGFAAACESKSISWLVFRGISDYGDPDKADDWHALASLHAALAVKTFLTTELRSEEVEF
jgi:nucleoside phosphorylase